MDIKELNLKVDHLAELRKHKNLLNDLQNKLRMEFEATLKPQIDEVMLISNEISLLQNEILSVLKESNTKNWKTDKATVSRKSTVSYNIVDRDKVIAKLKEMKLDGEYTRVEIIPQVKLLFEKQDFDGVEKTEKEFISVIVRQDGKPGEGKNA